MTTACAQPLVSVIIPTYNRPDLLISALDSILGQTLQDFEVVVVNDGGYDVKEIVCARDPKQRVKYCNNSANRGPNACRNQGLKVSRGRYIAYLDDDDHYYPDHLETLVSFLEANSEAIAYSDAFEAQNFWQGQRRVTALRELAYSCDFDVNRLALWSFVPTLCLMHARACTEVAGSFDEKMKRCEDWEMWIRLSRHFPFAHVRKATCEFSTLLNGYSLRSEGIMPHLESTIAIRSKHSDWFPKAYEGLFYPIFLKQLLTIWWSRGRDQVIEILHKLIDAEPGNAAAVTDLANFCFHSGYPDKAITLLCGITGRVPNYQPAWVVLAESYVGLGRTSEAEHARSIALGLDRWDRRATEVLIGTGSSNASSDEVVSRGAALSPRRIGNGLPEVRMYLDSSPEDKFVAEALAFIQPHPWREIVVSRRLESEVEARGSSRSLFAEMLLWLAYERRGDRLKIDAVCRSIVEKFRGSDWYPEWKGSIRVFYNFASRLEETGNHDLAYNLFLRLAEALHSRGGLPNELGGAYFHLGQILFKQGQWDRARGWFHLCLEQIHSHRNALVYLGKIEDQGLTPGECGFAGNTATSSEVNSATA